jgi:outer membrane protein assembly factor BamA
VQEGPRYVVRSVRTTGVESTRAALVERATRLEPGAPASPANAESIRRRLYDLGTFRSADVTYEPVAGAATAAGRPVDAVVSLQESRRFLFLYGVEATNQYQSLFDQRVTTGGLAADLRDRNFLGRGWTLGGGVRYEPSYWTTRVLASVPRVGSRRIRTNLYADTRSEDRARNESVIFRDDETAVTLEQRWRPRTPVEFSWGYRFDHRDLQFVSVESGQRIIGFDGYLAGLAGAVVVDRRDNLFDARRGWLASTSTEWGLRPLGSDFDYLRTLVRASYYQPAGPLTLASSVRWGQLLSFGGRPPLTVLDLFYQAGGTQTVRGYRQDSLSAYQLTVPGSTTTVPIGGTSLLVVNQEVRFPLVWRLGGVAFADAGNTFTEERGIVLADMAVGLGVGLRIRTPLAPVRLDIGFPVSRRPGESAYHWHFSIGQIF